MIKLLDWDTNFFGFKVGQINTSDVSLDLSNIVSIAKQMGFRLIYAFVSPDDAQTNAYFSEISLLVDEKITYSLNIKNNAISNQDNNITSWIGKQPNETLINLAYESGIESRFKTDANIQEQKFKELYKLWLINSLNTSIADEVFAYITHEDIQGFVSIKGKTDKADIGLIAVSGKQRGKGIGKQLLHATVNWCTEKNIKTLNVVTQKANKDACMFYEKYGFKELCTTNIYHLWL